MNNKKLDETVAGKVNHVQKHNGINVFWDKEGVWRKIQKALSDSTSGPKMIAWYGAMAASVSLLAATTLSVDFVNLPWLQESSPAEIAEVMETPERKTKRTEPIKAQFVSLPADSMIIPSHPKSVTLVQPQANIHQTTQLPAAGKLYDLAEVVDKTALGFNQKKSIIPKGFFIEGGISANRRSISPKVDLGVYYNLSNSIGKQQRIKLGGSIQFTQSTAFETGRFNFTRSYFVKTAFENTKVVNGKKRSWSTGVEYQVFSEEPSTTNNAFRLFYTRSIRDWLRIGPEVMFTKGFRKAYPGITLAFG